MTKRFDWDDLRYFLAVCRAGTISLAGRRTGTDHATVSRRIAALEAALDAQLFERNPRGYNLTRQGERLLAHAESMEREAERVQEEMAGRQRGLTGTIRVNTLEGFGNFFLAPRLAEFASAHPRLSIELIAIQQIIALSRRDSDIGVTLNPPTTGRFVSERLTDYRLFVYASRDYLASHPPIRSRDDLSRHAFAGYVDDLIFTRGLDYLFDVSPGLRARLQSSSLQAQMEIVRAGFGLCVLPAFIARRFDDLVAVLPHDVALTRTYWIAAHGDVAESAPVRMTLRFIRQEVEAAQNLFLDLT